LLNRYSITLTTNELFVIEFGIKSRYLQKRRKILPSFLIQKYMKQYIFVFVYEVLNSSAR